MSTKILVLGFILCVPGLSWAQEKQRPPFATPPAIAMAKAVIKDGVVELQLAVPVQVPEQRTRTIVRNGKKVEENYLVFVASVVETIAIADNKQVIVSRKDGKKVDPKELPKLLEKRTAVLLFNSGEFDPYYLQVCHDQVLVVTILPKNNVPLEN